MSLIFWGLVLLTAVFAGSFVYRISSEVREYNRDREQKMAARYGIASRETMGAEFDLFLLRWACVFAVLTIIWGLVEGLYYLIS